MQTNEKYNHEIGLKYIMNNLHTSVGTSSFPGSKLIGA
jgi:hypothetical protein